MTIHTEKFSKFENETAPTLQTTMPSSNSQIYKNQQNQTYPMNQTLSEHGRRSKLLAIIEMVISCILLVVGAVSIAVATNFGPYYYTTSIFVLGTKIWAPVLGIISAGLGLGVFRKSNLVNRCLLTAHFVMCIISSVAFGILCVLASTYIASGLFWLLTIFEVITILCALTNCKFLYI